jgi:hypothetical protein
MCLNPTINKQPEDIRKIPFLKLSDSIIRDLSKRNYLIKINLSYFDMTNRNYRVNPFLWALNKVESSDLFAHIRCYYDFENFANTQILLNEAIINEKIFKTYDLTSEDRVQVIDKEGESVGNLPVLPDAKRAYFNERIALKEFPLNHIQDFIQSLPGKDFTPEEIKTIVDSFSILYQGNNNIEDFCIRHHVNPINVWYWFKESNVVPKQRTNEIAIEFLADMIREILMDDDDGIAPLVRSAGEEILIDRIEKKFIEKGFSAAKMFSDHLKLFKQLPSTPFIWHITSGPNHGFDAYISIHKWNRDRLFSLKSVYIEKRKTALKNRQSDLQNDNSAKAQNEKDLIEKQLIEIDNLKSKIDELLAEGYKPVLDDGVGKNIAPLQKKGIIAYEVLTKAQLEKYLNADW